ncbi:Lipase [Lachnellula hyalina]|uniref:Carboxylic ester hydrolase n=1 Tax=Lachnellula hyalina TaxID=1316788 RepID=A0A8H8R1J3_9HELO|nr:Lipase [Lachnellula hyalina]TVY26803.1 Lipase [Lachnellula hyalina]
MRLLATHSRYAVFLFLLSSGILCEGLTGSSSPVVDLGYGIFEGYFNETSQLDIYKGIRYASPPVGELRWQKPEPPAVNRTKVTPAVTFAPRCPQSPNAPLSATYNFTASGLGNEDCLFLSIYSPQNATNLPIMFWIHGGGYGSGYGVDDFSELVMSNAHGFIVVVIQYRLGAFGFLSSSEVSESGVPNAGLHDQHFALEWVQKYIGNFGGDPARVTVAGESAGGGSVMLQAMAYGGTEGTEYFNNAIVASPYLPMQWDFDGVAPTQSYALFAQAAGCLDAAGGNETDGNVFACLQAKDSITLQNASAQVSGHAKYGQWAFLPVTDGEFVQKRPTEQLLAGEVNGVRILSGNNADEGPGFVPQSIETNEDFDVYLQDLFPLMDNETLSKLALIYNIPATIPGPLFSTLGTSNPTALNQSEFAIGQQQRANNLYAETTFVCPSYWLASAYSSQQTGPAKQSWKYQYSVPPSEHGADLDAYEAIGREALGLGTLSTGFRTAVQKIWGRFIVFNDPTLPAPIVKNIVTLPNGTLTGDNLTAAGEGFWPTWEGDSNNGAASYRMLNLNMTGGHETHISWDSADGVTINVTQYAGPGLSARFDIVDAWSWEGDRGARCEFWADIGELVPE